MSRTRLQVQDHSIGPSPFQTSTTEDRYPQPFFANQQNGSVKPQRQPSSSPDPPTWFVCPISQQLMRCPVVISSGITYDKDSIVHWFESGSNFCPVTRTHIEDPSLMIENVVLRGEILAWMEQQTRLGRQVDDLVPKVEHSHTNVSSPPSKESVQTILDSIMAVFLLLDENNDGFISPLELAVAEQQAWVSSQLPRNVRQKLSGRFSRLDTDHDGRISRAEFVTLLADTYAAEAGLATPQLTQHLLQELHARYPPPPTTQLPPLSSTPFLSTLGSDLSDTDTFIPNHSAPPSFAHGMSGNTRVQNLQDQFRGSFSGRGAPFRSVASASNIDHLHSAHSVHSEAYGSSFFGPNHATERFSPQKHKHTIMIAIACCVFLLMCSSSTTSTPQPRALTVFGALSSTVDALFAGLGWVMALVFKCIVACMVSLGIAQGVFSRSGGIFGMGGRGPQRGQSRLYRRSF